MTASTAPLKQSKPPPRKKAWAFCLPHEVHRPEQSSPDAARVQRAASFRRMMMSRP